MLVCRNRDSSRGSPLCGPVQLCGSLIKPDCVIRTVRSHPWRREKLVALTPRALYSKTIRWLLKSPAWFIHVNFWYVASANSPCNDSSPRSTFHFRYPSTKLPPSPPSHSLLILHPPPVALPHRHTNFRSIISCGECNRCSFKSWKYFTGAINRFFFTTLPFYCETISKTKFRFSQHTSPFILLRNHSTNILYYLPF